jgi:FkbM family methyltransferase
MIPLNKGCFVDVGANFGIWTRYVAKMDFKVHAFEPSPQPFKHLAKNAPPNVYVYNVALGEKEGEGLLNLHDTHGHDGLVKKAKDFTGKTIKVPIKTLDSFKIKNVGLIKIDTEGYEIPVLLGARKTILRWKPRIIIEVHSPYKEQTTIITNMLKKMGYAVIRKHKLRTYQPMLIGEPVKNQNYSLAKAREYWKYAPSSIGNFKISSEELLKMTDEDLKKFIEKSIKLRNTKKAINRVSAWICKENVRNMLDFGCGLGQDGVYLSCNLGINVTFADIVESNVKLTRRYRRIWNIPTKSIYIKTNPKKFKFPEIYDMVFANGVLHHTPEAKEIVKNLTQYLKPNGLFICMLYTPKHFESMRVETIEEYALVSEGSAPLLNPYTDYYTLDKAKKLFEDYTLLETFTTNNGKFGWYVWRK